MIRQEQLNKVRREEENRRKTQDKEFLREDGIAYFKGNIISYKKWQNSAAKHHDFKAHQGAVYACRLSPCQHYVLSCSEDRTARLWVLKTA